MHRNINPENIMVCYVNDEKVLKFSDFGTAKIPEDGQPNSLEECEQWYRPPECLIKDKNYGMASDVFSLGVVFAEFYTLEPYFQGKNNYEQMQLYCDVVGSPDKANYQEGY